MNPLRRELLHKINVGKKLTKDQIIKMSVRILVLKDGEPVCSFKSYADLDKNSKNIFGFTLWNVYVRKVINGEMDNYHGYTFKTF